MYRYKREHTLTHTHKHSLKDTYVPLFPKHCRVFGASSQEFPRDQGANLKTSQKQKNSNTILYDVHNATNNW